MAAISSISITPTVVQPTEAISSSSSPESVIFLDIDGVLNTGAINIDTAYLKDVFPEIDPEKECYTSYHYDIATTHFFGKAAVNRLEMLIKKIPNVAIVLTSQWRKDKTIEKIREIFKKHHFAQSIVDKTPDKLSEKDNEHYGSRGMNDRASEIAYWLERHPEITNFVILDDIDIGLSKTFSKNFVHVSTSQLLSEENIRQAASILGHPFDNKERSMTDDTTTHTITRQPTPILTASTTSIAHVRPIIQDERKHQTTLTSTSVNDRRAVTEDTEPHQKPAAPSSCCIIL